MNPKRHEAREKRGIGRKSGQGAIWWLPAVYGARPGGNRERKDEKKTWRRPTLPRTSRSTIGEEAFHFRVRDGNEWEPPLSGHQEDQPETEDSPRPLVLFRERERQYGQASRLISTGRLNTLPCLYRQPIKQIVCLFPSGPSRGQGCLILRRASRLDAFSGYPFRTWLPGSCPWQDNRHTRGPSTSVLSY